MRPLSQFTWNKDVPIKLEPVSNSAGLIHSSAELSTIISERADSCFNQFYADGLCLCNQIDRMQRQSIVTEEFT